MQAKCVGMNKKLITALEKNNELLEELIRQIKINRDSNMPILPCPSWPIYPQYPQGPYQPYYPTYTTCGGGAQI